MDENTIPKFVLLLSKRISDLGPLDYLNISVLCPLHGLLSEDRHLSFHAIKFLPNSSYVNKLCGMGCVCLLGVCWFISLVKCINNQARLRRKMLWLSKLHRKCLGKIFFYLKAEDTKCLSQDIFNLMDMSFSRLLCISSSIY